MKSLSKCQRNCCRCQTNFLINFKKLHRRILDFLFLFDLWNHLASFFSSFLTSSSSFFFEANNETEKIHSLRTADEDLRLLIFHLSQTLEEDYRLGQEGNVVEDYQACPCSTLKDSFSPLDSANPSSHCWFYA